MSESSSETVPSPPPGVAPALELLERGDHRGARRLLQGLLAQEPPPEVRAAAQELQARLAPDPRALAVGLATAALIALLVVHYVL